MPETPDNAGGSSCSLISTNYLRICLDIDWRRLKSILCIAMWRWRWIVSPTFLLMYCSIVSWPSVFHDDTLECDRLSSSSSLEFVVWDEAVYDVCCVLVTHEGREQILQSMYESWLFRQRRERSSCWSETSLKMRVNNITPYTTTPE